MKTVTRPPLIVWTVPASGRGQHQARYVFLDPEDIPRRLRQVVALGYHRVSRVEYTPSTDVVFLAPICVECADTPRVAWFTPSPFAHCPGRPTCCALASTYLRAPDYDHLIRLEEPERRTPEI